jgi:hypothetical protein
MSYSRVLGNWDSSLFLALKTLSLMEGVDILVTVDRLLELLEEELIKYDNKVEEYDLKVSDAIEAGDHNTAAYWSRLSDQAWQRTKDIRTTILVIKERLGG